jgi:hypothetical protein
MTPKIRKVVPATVALACLAGAQSFAGVVGDHLKCYKAKETAGPGRIQVQADLVSTTIPALPTETGCVIKGPPQLYCGPVAKTNVSPEPPGGGPTQSTTKFLCYKVKCPKGASEIATARDQFGMHTMALKVPKVVCAPASPSGAFLEEPFI